MSGNDRFVSPYLLRPLRTLEQVLGGRSNEAELWSGRIEDRQMRDCRDEPGGTGDTTIDASDARRSAERP